MNCSRFTIGRCLPSLACALVSLLWLPAHAELGPKTSTHPLDEKASARVVVRFKTALPVTAATATSVIQSAAAPRGTAAPSEADVQQALQVRAGALGQRHGWALRAGHAVDERTQVVTAQGADAVQLAAQLRADPEVEFAVVDGRRRAVRVPNDPLYQPSPVPANGPTVGQWYLKPPQAAVLGTGNEILASIDAQGAWDTSTGSSSMVVAVLDTGVRFDHPDLQGKLLPGFDMISDATVANDGNGRDADASDPGDWITSSDKANDLFKDCDVADSSWHGTMTAGLIGAATDNGTGMAGVGWNVKVLPVRVLGKCFGYDSDIVAGMRWAAGLSVPGVPANPNPARVLNLSLGGTDSTVTPCSQTLYAQAVSDVAATGAVIVVAAGNGTGRAVQPPGNCPGVITVAGVRHIGTKVGYSNIGPEVSIAAPAGNCVNTAAGQPCLFPILSTTNAGLTTPGANTYGDSFNYAVGTSFSAPLVAGTAALMLSANPALTPAQVQSILASTARVFPFRNAPADTSGPVPQCTAPGSTDQSQCYCTTSTCGAGMLDASWAVYSAANAAPAPVIGVSGAAPGQTVTLSSAATTAASGRQVVSQQWTLLDGGGIVSGFNGGGATASGPTVTLTPSAEGQFSVRLIVTDSAGVQGVHEQTVAVSTPPPPADSGGGGGAMSAAWLAGLALAVAALGPRLRLSSQRRRG